LACDQAQGILINLKTFLRANQAQFFDDLIQRDAPEFVPRQRESTVAGIL
jgi:hypothetical protein